jgi:hypothetical protein
VALEALSHAERGRRGAERRWKDHAPKTVHLDDLTVDQRRLVLALVEAERAKNIEADR